MKLLIISYLLVIAACFDATGQCGTVTAGGNTGPKTVTGNCSITGNVTLSSGNLTINSGATLTISGNLVNNGNGTITNNGTLSVGTNFQNNSSGTFLNAGSLDVGTYFLNKDNGTINFSSGTVTIGTNFTNQGNGAMNFGGVVHIGGNFSNTSNGLLSVSGGLTVSGSLTSSDNGNVTVANGGVLSAGSLNVSNTVTIANGGTLAVPGTVSAGTLSNGATNGDQVCNNGCCGANCNTAGTGLNSTAQGTLPITLLYFKAESTENSTVLTWSTATEINTSHFEIHRANESGEFYYLGEVPAFGNTKKRQNYVMTDISPAEGINLYRLISVDFDGYREVFAAKSTNSSGGVLNVFPNPFDGYEVNVSKPANSSTPTIKIYSLSGRELFCGVMQLGQTKVKLDNPLLSGVYMLTLKEGAQTFSTRIVVK